MICAHRPRLPEAAGVMMHERTAGTSGLELHRAQAERPLQKRVDDCIVLRPTVKGSKRFDHSVTKLPRLVINDRFVVSSRQARAPSTGPIAVGLMVYVRGPSSSVHPQRSSHDNAKMRQDRVAKTLGCVPCSGYNGIAKVLKLAVLCVHVILQFVYVTGQFAKRLGAWPFRWECVSCSSHSLP